MTGDQELLDELDLGGFAPRLHGIPAKEFYVEYVRDLTPADLEALVSLPRAAPTPPLTRIHSSHHAVARCIAAGMKPAQVSLVTGYTTVRVDQLSRDPAFIALVADYRAEAKGTFADMAERMNNISLDALDLLQERLLAAPGDFTIDALLDVVKVFADRTGHGPNQEINLKVDTSAMVDRPPRETFEEWQQRRSNELRPKADTDSMERQHEITSHLKVIN